MFKAREYVRVKSIEEAWNLNQKKSNVIVGGMMWLKMGRGQKGTVIDLSGLGLDTIEETEEEFSIGCMCTLRQLELHEGLNKEFDGIFRECTRHIVGTQFRNGATVGGSVFGRYGFSDILTCLLALDSYVELYQGGIIPLAQFTSMPYDRDVLVRIVIKKDGRKAAYLSQRNTQTDFPLIACAAGKKGDDWYVSVGARPKRAAVYRISGTGKKADELAREAASMFEYGSNLRGSGEYRAHLANVYVRRLIETIEKREA